MSFNTYPPNPFPPNSEEMGEGGGGQYVLPVASADTLGGVKVGNNLSIDGNGVLSVPLLNYSTSEQDTGILWVDGKKIYQKTIQFDTTVGNTVNIDLTESAIDRLVDVVFHLGKQDGLQIAGGIGYYNGAQDYINGYYDENDKNYHVRFGTGYWRSATNYATVLYTKIESEE